MSIIYDALKKLKKSEETQEEEELTAKPQDSNVIVFDDLLKRHAIKTYTILGLIILAISGWLYQLSQFEYHASTPKQTVQVRPAAQVNNEEIQEQSPEAKNQDLPEPPTPPVQSNIVVSHIKPETDQPEPVQIEVFSQTEDTDLLFAENDNKMAPPTIQPEPTTSPSIQQNNIQQVEEFIFTPESNSEDFSYQPEDDPQTQENPPAAKQAKTTHEYKHETKIRPPSPKKQTDSTDFSPVIHTLNEELHKSINAKDFATGQEILTELEQLLGKESHYILNLKAYFLLQSGDTNAAHETLKIILKDNENNLEAGLNLIVVLAKQGEIKQAQKQVRYLLNYYPANQSLLYFKQQLEE